VRPYLENTHHKNGLVEWLKVKALSSSPSTAKKKKKKKLKGPNLSTLSTSLKENVYYGIYFGRIFYGTISIRLRRDSDPCVFEDFISMLYIFPGSL
jgi:hypothetical protein